MSLFFRGEGVLPLLFGRDGRIVAEQSEARMASRHKGGTPSPQRLGHNSPRFFRLLCFELRPKAALGVPRFRQPTRDSLYTVNEHPKA